jgi:hypothetical protein
VSAPRDGPDDLGHGLATDELSRSYSRALVHFSIDEVACMPFLHLPEFEEAQLLFDERETREILRFFWPGHSPAINALASIDNEIRKLAQGLLVAAIDSSYAMGFVEILFDALRPGRPGFVGLKVMGRKLAARYVAHWWKHTRPQDLQSVRIYESVRRTLAANFKPVIDILLAEHSAAKAAAAFAQLRQRPLRIETLQGDRAYWS